MTFCRTFVNLSLLVCALLTATVCFGAPKENLDQKYKLKPGAQGKLCLSCHQTFEEKLKKAFVHTPLKNAECTGCHSPHASAHGKMLDAEGGAVCASCHDSVVPKGAKSTHKPVLDGLCLKCHDPHASANKNNLVKPLKELCSDCHKALVEGVTKAKFPHRPVEKGCENCHLPHASAAGEALLSADVVTLCTGCHKTDKPIFIKQHMNYPVGKVRCTTCHNPHGSDRPGLLYNNVHKPVASKMCSQCHEEATSANPLKLKKEGEELCKTCHSIMVNRMTEQSRVHWPALAKDGCLSCHNPHAANQKGLLRQPMLTLCGRCHDDTIQRQEKSVTKHEPIQEGVCTSCHDVHSSNNELLLKGTTTIDLCGTCHDWQKHSTHPVGTKVVDKRNKNLSVQCLSCHRSHGTEYKSMIPFPTVSDLCVQCHAELRR